MSRDYKHRAQSGRNRRKGLPAWKLVAALLVVAAFGGFLIALTQQPGGRVSAAADQKSVAIFDPSTQKKAPETRASHGQPSATQNDKAPQTSSTPKNFSSHSADANAGKAPDNPGDKPARPTDAPETPKWTFYDKLVRKSVVISEAEINALNREETERGTPKGELYALRVGTYPNVAEAERLKGKLLKLKVKADIQTIKDQANTWYRVRVGPFNSVGALEKLRAELKRAEIDSMPERLMADPQKKH